MPYIHDTASDYLDLLDRLRRFAAGYGVAGSPSFSGAGNGSMGSVDTDPASVSETWTVACTDATTPGAEVWSVVGSVSGAKADATTGIAYDNSLVKFQIAAGATNFQVGDQFTLAVVQGALSAAGQAWAEERWAPGDELILRGPGLAGADNIYVGILTTEDPANDYYNWMLQGYTGYSSGAAWSAQPGAIGTATPPQVALWNQSIPYWLCVDGRRIVLVAKVSTVYESLYLGLIDPYGSPGQWAYPIFIGGSMTAFAGARWSVTAEDHRQWVSGNIQGATQASGFLRRPDGVWAPAGNATNNNLGPNTYPFYGPSAGASRVPGPATIRDCLDGTFFVLPVIALQGGNLTRQMWGEFRGAGWTAAWGLSAESICTVGADQYLLVPNVYRTGTADYWLLKLE